MIIGYRARWTSYCYNGGALDPNTGCVDFLSPAPPSKEELDKWARLNQCEICHSYSNAWGSDAEVCLKNPEPCNVWVERQEVEKVSTNNHFAYHTCELNWRCGVSYSKIPLMLKMVGKVAVPFFALPNGTLGKVNEYFKIDGQTAIHLSKNQNVKTNKMEMKCVKENDKYWCIDPDSRVGFPIDEKSREFCLYSVCYVYSYISKPKRIEGDYKIKHASIDDLQSFLAKEMMDVEELKYTVLQISHRTLVLEALLLKLINSVSKIDDKLIPKIVSGDFSTEFLSNDAFLIKPCLKEPNVGSNCIGNKIFKEGRWIVNKNKANCINLQKIKEIDLFNVLDIWLPEVSENKAMGTPDDYTGWSFYAHNKEALIDTMEFTRNGGKGTSFQDVLDMPEGMMTNTLSSLLGFSITSIIIIAVIVVVIFIICKKL